MAPQGSVFHSDTGRFQLQLKQLALCYCSYWHTSGSVSAVSIWSALSAFGDGCVGRVDGTAALLSWQGNWQVAKCAVLQLTHFHFGECMHACPCSSCTAQLCSSCTAQLPTLSYLVKAGYARHLRSISFMWCIYTAATHTSCHLALNGFWRRCLMVWLAGVHGLNSTGRHMLQTLLSSAAYSEKCAVLCLAACPTRHTVFV